MGGLAVLFCFQLQWFCLSLVIYSSGRFSLVTLLISSQSLRTILMQLLPVCASKQGNVIGFVRIYIYMCVQKNCN